jgi:penicillin-insensitive murein DD-endopeptidase
MRRVLSIGCIVSAGCLLVSSGVAGVLESAWSRAQYPAAGPALALGTYTAGCVQGAKALPAEDARYMIMRPERRRTFGHPQLIDFVSQLSQQMEKSQLGPLGVGDLGQARGGPAPNGHASHQNGLDVDLWFSPGVAAAEQRSMVDFETQKPSAYYSDRVPKLLEMAASDARVARIFVNAVIKRELCEHGSGERSWLGKLRPWWGHHEHFHVRLACPDNSPGCLAQPPIPAGDGCDELDWWLNPESVKDRTRGVETYGKRVGAQPKLPAGCETLVR